MLICGYHLQVLVTFWNFSCLVFQLSIIPLPWRILRKNRTAVTNNKEVDEEVGWELEGTGHTSRNPARKRVRFAWGPFWDEFVCLDMKNCKVPLVPTTFMIKSRQLPGQSFESGQGKLWYEKPRLQKWYVHHCSARPISLLFHSLSLLA